jgi:hypothetical protein
MAHPLHTYIHTYNVYYTPWFIIVLSIHAHIRDFQGLLYSLLLWLYYSIVNMNILNIFIVHYPTYFSTLVSLFHSKLNIK